MADQSTLDALSAAPRFNDPAVDLLVVYDGNQFRKPWSDGDRQKHGSLKCWEWRDLRGLKQPIERSSPAMTTISMYE